MPDTAPGREAAPAVPATAHGAPAALHRYRYLAREAVTGRRHAGEHDGESAYAVRCALRRIGLQAIRIELVAEHRILPALRPFVAAWHARQRRTRRLVKADLCDALATLLQVGVTLEDALTSLIESISQTPMERALAGRLRDHLRSGLSFNDSCALEPGWFDQFDIALIAAGLQSGDLTTTLSLISQHHQRSGSFAQKLFVALAYPAVLATAGLGVLEFMSFKVIPQMVQIITQAKKQPPPLTLTVMHAGQALALWWPLALLLVIGAIWGGRTLAGRIGYRSRLGALVHGNVLARMRRRYRAAQLAWSLSRLRQAGIPLAHSISIVADTVDDPPLQALLHETVAGINRGEDFSAVIGASTLLDPEFAKLLGLGERSGELTQVLDRIAERCFRSADRTADRLAALVGPLAIVMLALIIGVIVLSCALPLAQLGDSL